MTTQTQAPIDRSAFRFFLENAGYATPPGRVACAAALARAETEARQRSWGYLWTEDDNADLSWADDDDSTVQRRLRDGTYTAEGCILQDASGEVLMSLWNIVGPLDDPYRRVIEAELALEALDAPEPDPLPQVCPTCQGTGIRKA